MANSQLAKARSLLDDGDAEGAMKEAAALADKESRVQKSEDYCEAVCLKIGAMKAQDKSKEAKPIAKEFLNDMRQKGFSVGEGIAHLAMADLYTKKMGSHGREVAKNSAFAALQIFATEQKDSLKARAMMALAQVRFAEVDKNYENVSFREEEMNHALDECKAALDIYQQLGDKRREAEAQSSIAHAYCFGDIGDWEPAAKESLRINKELNLEQKVAYDLYMMAYWYHMKKDWDNVLEKASESMAMFKDQNHKRGYIAACLSWVYKSHMEKKEPEEAITAVKDMLVWFVSHEDRQGQAACHDLLVDLHIDREETEEALTAAEQGLELVRAMGDKRWESNVLHGIANAHMAKESAEGKDKAVLAMQQSLKVFQKCKDLKGEGLLYHDLAHIFMAKEKYKEALLAAQKERTCFKRAKNELMEGTALMTIYQVHLHRRKATQAVKAVTEAIKIFQKHEDQAREASAQVISASGFMMNGQKKEALEGCKKSLKLCQQLNDREGEAYALSMIQQIETPEPGQQQAAAASGPADITAEDQVAVSAATVESLIAALDIDLVSEKVTEIAISVSGNSEDMSLDIPLMDAGLDSLSAVAFRNELLKNFDGCKVPAQVVFDYPTVRQVSQELVDISTKRAISMK